MRLRKLLFALLLLLPFVFNTPAFAQDKATKSLTLVVNSSAVVLAPATLPNGMVGLLYQTSVTATGGLAPYTFTATGTLPAGVSLSTAGVFSGTPTTVGPVTFTVQAADSETPAVTATQSYTVTIVPTLAITTATLSAANIGVAYSATIAATGGVPPYTFAVTTGALPTGITLNPTTGVLSGTPTSAGSFVFTITATDAGSNIVRLEIKSRIEVASLFVRGTRS